MTNFDQIYNRNQTNSVKWDTIAETYHETDLIPLWVADMDFKAPQGVQAALAKYVEQGIYGYSIFPDSLYEAIIKWEQEQHHFQLLKEDILFSPGVVPSIALMIQTFTEVGDSVLINNPVYHPFTHMINNNQRKLVANNLVVHNHHFEFDFELFERQVIEENVKMFILCNPHNPGGRVWTSEELKRIGTICQRHDVFVVSDEIHQDLVFAPYQHNSFQTLDESFSAFSVVLTAATKTFNLAGVKNSMIFAKNQKIRQAIIKKQAESEQDTINTFGIIATQAAYETDVSWRKELLSYIEANVQSTCDILSEQLPQVAIMRPEGTYLMWLNFSAFGLSDSELQAKLIHEAKVVMNPGIMFGSQGHQHMRLNVACPQNILARGLNRIVAAFK